ncbi:MAG: glycosyltransferase [Steroidobacteraceae bacterium]
MNDFDTSLVMTRPCAVCGSLEKLLLGQRSDGVNVLRCRECGMGVIETVPDDLMLLYTEAYYGTGRAGYSPEARSGYEDYAYTAEHGTAWAAALVRLFCPNGGRVLDIGCADGHLLTKLGPRYDLYGIEANETIGGIASRRGVTVVGQDLLDPAIAACHAGSFDVITAIAVFEHLKDIRAAFETSIHLLRDGGIMLFEVPLISAVNDNAVWFTSSLEHVWYPSEESLCHLVENETGCRLVGTELAIKGYGSTYIGLVFRHGEDAGRIRALASRVITAEAEPASSEERAARMLLRLVHAADPSHEDIGALAGLQPCTVSPALFRRIAELWQADLWRYKSAQAEIKMVSEELANTTAKVRHLEAELNIVKSDRALSQIELTNGIVAASTRLESMRSELMRKTSYETKLVAQKLELEAQLASQRLAVEQERAVASDLSAAQAAVEQEWAQIRQLQTGGAWRIAMIVREGARRYPRLARPARKAARVLWWIARGRLVTQLRSRRTARAALKAPALEGAGLPKSREQLRILPFSPVEYARSRVSPVAAPQVDSSGVAPPPARPALELRLLEATGHRPPVLLQDSDRCPADRPVVSVVITSFNYGQFVHDALGSALAQTFRDLEVIVVEGGSSDPESRYVVAELDRPRTRVLMQGSSHLAGANRNFGISQARGKYICCLDADDVLRPTYIEKAIFLMERHGYDVVSSAMEMFGHSGGVIHIMEQPDLAALLEGNQMLICGVFRRSLWERAGGYRDADRNFIGYVYEDWAFWVRLALLGARFRNLQHDPMLKYRVHGANLSRGGDVLPMEQQREMIRAMNADLLETYPDAIERSRELASVRYGTPATPPAPICLDRSPQGGVQRPTLLLAMPFLILGGAERLLSSVVGDLVTAGWRVVIVTSIMAEAEHGDTTAWFEQHTGEIFHLPRFLPSEWWDEFLRHLVASRRVDVLWIVGSSHAYDNLRSLRSEFRDLKVADLLFNTVGHTTNNRRRRDLIDVTFVENNEVQNWLLGHGEESDRIRLVESGVDLMRLHPAGRSDQLVQQIGAARSDVIVGFCGRWSEEKDPTAFVEIARRVDPALPVRFVMTGTGPLRPEIDRAVSEGLFPKGRFNLLGEVPELAPILASFDLLVVPSRLDGRPIVVLEAFALGVPVLGSRVGALPELIQEGKTGWLCDPGDVAAFARRIERAARAPRDLALMRVRAREYAEARLDARNMFVAYRDALWSLMPEERRRLKDAEPGEVELHKHQGTCLA